MHTEYDTLGPVAIPSNKYWGAQTQRALIHFTVGTEKWPNEFIHVFGWQKWAAISANNELGLIPKDMVPALLQAAKEVACGNLDEHFPLSLWQSGSGTQIHMNVNEVIANYAQKLLNFTITVDANDHVNCGQSSNDSVPTVMHIALVQEAFTNFFPAVKKLVATLTAKSEEWKNIKKVGRTHLQDAVSLTLGEEFSAFAYQINECLINMTGRVEKLYEVAQGGTAVGNGLNSHCKFKELFFQFLNKAVSFPFKATKNSFAAQSAHDALVALSGDFNTLAVALSKIAQDLRLMTSGPMCGLKELIQPLNEPGSSIMPGKINPSQAEVLIMIAFQVIGFHHSTTLGGIGQFQLNTAKPLIFYNLWTSFRLLEQAIASFTKYFLEPLQPCLEVLNANTDKNLMDLTCLTLQLGYKKVAEIVARSKGLSIKEALEKEDLLSLWPK